MSRVFQGAFKSASKKFQGSIMRMSSSEVLNEGFKTVLGKFQELTTFLYPYANTHYYSGLHSINTYLRIRSFKKIKEVSSSCEVALSLKVSCCMLLIAATRAEGGLVYVRP